MAGAVVQVNSAAVNTATTAGTASLTSAATAGNTIVIAFAGDNYVTSGNKPSGFTEPTGARQEGFLGAYVWYKVAAGGEQNFSYTLTTPAATFCWVALELSGVGTLNVSNGTLNTSASTTTATPAVTPTAGGRFAVAAVGGSLNSAITGLGGWTNSYVEQADVATTLASGTRDGLGVATLSFTADGTTATSTTATWDGAITTQQETGIILVFQETAGGSNFTATQNDSTGLTDSVGAATVTPWVYSYSARQGG